ncbi:response regulator [Opitutus sp. ER46]|uniref:response regulator n=1 Tax=Opitutus sp. ER46 TaxID=2161864 RepID=UPI000D303C5C|nr:response regulator [Opitutus sp. ER46]PTY00676.1 two-component system response regulator [Opitutus sp. ER46]
MAHTILTVDDSKTVRIIIRNAFKRFDCEVIEASHGVEGLEKAKSKPNLILLDVTMPVMTGMELLARLHADPELAQIPVIMLTAEGQKTTAEQAVSLGSRGYIVKPFTNDVLLQEVAKLLTLEPRPAAA